MDDLSETLAYLFNKHDGLKVGLLKFINDEGYTIVEAYPDLYATESFAYAVRSHKIDDNGNCGSMRIEKVYDTIDDMTSEAEQVLIKKGIKLMLISANQQGF